LPEGDSEQDGEGRPDCSARAAPCRAARPWPGRPATS